MANIKPVEVLEHVASELTYLPTPEQRKVKSAFWTRFNENPICEPADITLTTVLKFIDDHRVPRWWPDQSFQQWFRNKDEFRQRMEYLAQLALDGLEFVLADPKSQATAKVNAAKLIMEVARKMPPKQAVEQYLDEKIANMDRRQLEEYIRKSVRLLPAAESITPAPELNPNKPIDN